MAGRIVRSGPITWAQAAEWHPLFWRGHGEWLPLHPRPWHVEGDVPVAAVRDAWVAMARRHEVLRSSFGVGPGGRPVQRVVHPDDFTAPVHVAPVGEFEAFVAAPRHLDPAGPHWTVTVFHDEDGFARGSCLHAEHVLYDAVGLRNWRAQVDALISDPDQVLDVVHPIDQANAEPVIGHPRVVRARARYANSLRHSAQVLIPATRPAERGRYLRSTATVTGLLPAVEDIARLCDTSPSTVLTYLTGWLFARLSRQRSLPIDLLYGNRAAQDEAIVVQVQHVFFSVDFDHEAPSAGIKELARTTLGALALGRMPRIVATEVRAAASVERGAGIREPLVVNVVSGSHARFDIAAGDEWRAAGVDFLNKISIVMYGADFDISLTVDATMVTAEDTAAMLADLPKAIEHVHDFPDEPLSGHAGWATTPFPLEDGVVRVGEDWVRPHRVAALIAGIPGVHTAEVDVDGAELVATVTHDGTVSYADVHEHVLATAWDHTDVVAPTRYRTSGSGDTWHVRDRAPTAPVTAAEKALHAAIHHTHGVSPDDFGDTYVTAGGDLDLGPAVVVALEERGYTGLRSTAFAAPLTLRLIAGGLRPVQSS